MDPLSDVLGLLKPQSHLASGFRAGGDWALGFARYSGIKCYSIVEGGCWLAGEDVEPVWLNASDCFLLTSGRPFRLATDLALRPADAEKVFSSVREGRIATVGDGGAFFLVGSLFLLTGQSAEFLLGLLPPIVQVRDPDGQAALRWSVDRMMRELQSPRPGSALMTQHLAHMMLLQALRLHVEEVDGHGVGWLFALTDKQIGGVMTAMHADPARRWTLNQLAKEAGMSRTVFAERFRQLTGETPLGYLTRWRMLLASERLVTDKERVASVANALGYMSESSFRVTFQKVMGVTPRVYAKRHSVNAGSSLRHEATDASQ